MSLNDQIVEALAKVQDPELRHPITDLGMVEDLEEKHPGQLAEALGITVNAVVLAHDVLDGFDGAAEIHLVVL